MDKFWQVFNLANDQNGIFGGDLIWGMIDFIKFRAIKLANGKLS